MGSRQRSAFAGWRLWAATTFAAALLLAPLSAQEKAAPRVSLGFAAAPPGRQVTIPLVLEGASGKKVGRVVSEVRFPATHLTFIRLEKAALLEEHAFEAIGQVREPAPDVSALATGRDKAAQEQETKVLDIRVSSKDEGRPLRDGILAYLVFRIPPGTNPEKTPEIVLKHQAKIFAGLTDTAAPLAVVSEEAKLVVENPGLPVFACFFYMH